MLCDDLAKGYERGDRINAAADICDEMAREADERATLADKFDGTMWGYESAAHALREAKRRIQALEGKKDE